VTAAATTSTHMRTATITLPDRLTGHVTRSAKWKRVTVIGKSEVIGVDCMTATTTTTRQRSTRSVSRRAGDTCTVSKCKRLRSLQQPALYFISVSHGGSWTRHGVMAFNPPALLSSALLRRNCAKSFPDRCGTRGRQTAESTVTSDHQRPTRIERQSDDAGPGG